MDTLGYFSSLLDSDNVVKSIKFDRKDDFKDESIFAIEDFITEMGEIPFPSTLQPHMQSSLSCSMGFLHGSDYIYITADSKLFLWNYNTGNVLNYEEMGSLIISVALVKPVKDVFVSSISNLIVVCTALDIYILGLSNEPSIKSTPFSTSSDNIRMLRVEGTKHGRIFMAGDDGVLYELTYENSNNSLLDLFGFEGSRAKKCQKISQPQNLLFSFLPALPPIIKAIPISLFNSDADELIDLAVDNVHDLIYTLSNQGIINVFSIRDGDCVKKSSMNCNEKLSNDSIVSIHSMFETEEGSGVNRYACVVAVSLKGTRLNYYTTDLLNGSGEWKCSYRSISSKVLSSIPSSFPLVESFVTSDLFLSSWGDGSGKTCISNVLRLSPPNLQSDIKDIEISSVLSGKKEEEIHAISSIHVYHFNKNIKSSQKGGGEEEEKEEGGKVGGRDVVGMKRKASRNIEEAKVSHHHQKSKCIGMLYPSGLQVYSLCDHEKVLSALLSKSPDNLRKFINFYGEDEICSMLFSLLVDIERDGNDSSKKVSFKNLCNALVSIGYKGSYKSNEFSAHCVGLSKYMANIVSPVWKSGVFNKNGFVSISSSTLQNISSSFSALHSFLTKENSVYTRKLENEGSEEEIDRVVSLIELVDRFKQMANLLIKFCEVSDNGSDDSKSKLFWKDIKVDKDKDKVTFKDLTTNLLGAELARELAHNATNFNLLKTSIQDVCPIFFSSGDLILQKALNTVGEGVFTLLKECAKKWGEEGLINETSLELAISQLIKKELYEGAVDLCLQCASFEAGDHLDKEAFLTDDDARTLCYNNCLKLFTYRYPFPSEVCTQIQDKLIKRSLTHHDRTFHFKVYNFLLSKKEQRFTDLFISAAIPTYAESFLNTLSNNNPLSSMSKKDRLILLLKCLEAHDNRNVAAHISSTISTLDDADITLESRIEYLLSAISNAKLCAGLGSGGFDFNLLKEYEIRLTLARAQEGIIEELENSLNSSSTNERIIKERALESLRHSLLSLQNLFDMCDSMSLHESVLNLLHISDVNNPDVVQKHWSGIFAKAITFSELANSIEKIGREFYHPIRSKGSVDRGDYCFPVKFIIFKLLSLRFSEQPDPEKFNEIFRNVGLSRRRLIQTYMEIHQEGVVSGDYILQLIYCEIKKWLIECYKGGASASEKAVFRDLTAKWLLPWVEGMLVKINKDRIILFRNLRDELEEVAN